MTKNIKNQINDLIIQNMIKIKFTETYTTEVKTKKVTNSVRKKSN